MALHLAGLDVDAAGQMGIVQSRGYLHALIYVGSARADLDVLSQRAGVDLAEEEVGAFLGDALGDFAYDDAVNAFGEVDQLFYFETAGEKSVLQLLGTDVNIYIFFQPAERYFHGLLPP